MSKLDPKFAVIALAALVAAGALGFVLARQAPPAAPPPPLAVVTVDRIAEQDEAKVAALEAERDDLAARLEAVTVERNKALSDLVVQRTELARRTSAPADGEEVGGEEVGGEETGGEAAAERDALAARVEQLSAQLEAQAVTLQEAAEEAVALRQAVATAQAEAEALRQRAAAVAEPAPGPAAASAAEGAEGFSEEQIERAVEAGLKAYQAKDFDTAFQTWQPLADQGVARAQFYVGALYRDGAGVGRDMVQAYVWLKRSDDLGYIYAKGLLDRVSKEMTPEQLAEAQAVLDAQ